MNTETMTKQDILYLYQMEKDKAVALFTECETIKCNYNYTHAYEVIPLTSQVEKLEKKIKEYETVKEIKANKQLKKENKKLTLMLFGEREDNKKRFEELTKTKKALKDAHFNIYELKKEIRSLKNEIEDAKQMVIFNENRLTRMAQGYEERLKTDSKPFETFHNSITKDWICRTARHIAQDLKDGKLVVDSFGDVIRVEHTA